MLTHTHLHTHTLTHTHRSSFSATHLDLHSLLNPHMFYDGGEREETKKKMWKRKRAKCRKTRRVNGEIITG